MAKIQTDRDVIVKHEQYDVVQYGKSNDRHIIVYENGENFRRIVKEKDYTAEVKKIIKGMK